MTLRIIDDLFTHGHPDLRLAHPRQRFARIIGEGFPEAKSQPLNEQDPAGAREATFREWLAHVEAGRVGA